MAKISAQEFMKKENQTGRKSKLDPFQDDILLLKTHGYTQQQILDFLKMNDVVVGMTTLNWFIRSRSDKKTPQKKVQTKISPAGERPSSPGGNTDQSSSGWKNEEFNLDDYI